MVLPVARGLPVEPDIQWQHTNLGMTKWPWSWWPRLAGGRAIVVLPMSVVPMSVVIVVWRSGAMTMRVHMRLRWRGCVVIVMKMVVLPVVIHRDATLIEWGCNETACVWQSHSSCHPWVGPASVVRGRLSHGPPLAAAVRPLCLAGGPRPRALHRRVAMLSISRAALDVLRLCALSHAPPSSAAAARRAEQLHPSVVTWPDCMLGKQAVDRGLSSRDFM